VPTRHILADRRRGRISLARSISPCVTLSILALGVEPTEMRFRYIGLLLAHEPEQLTGLTMSVSVPSSRRQLN
jgi:hypothetical protein